MKKAIILVTSMLMTLIVNAQVDINSAKNVKEWGESVIPPDLSFDGETKLVGIDYPNYDKFYIYDSDFNETVVECSGTPLNYIDLSPGGFTGGSVYISQTLFNDDEEYEFVDLIDDGSEDYEMFKKYIGFKICTPTKTIQEVYFGDNWLSSSSSLGLIKFYEKHYIIANLSDADDIFNRITRVYRISKDSPTGIIEMKNISTPLSNLINQKSRIYTVDGKLTNEPQHGVSIVKMNDGTTKKVMMK